MRISSDEKWLWLQGVQKKGVRGVGREKIEDIAHAFEASIMR